MLSVALYLFRLFNSVVTFRMGASGMPASPPLIIICTAVYFVLGATTAHILGKPASTAIVAAAVDCVFYLLWYGGVVYLFGKPERVQQTLLAVLLIGWLAAGFGLMLATPIANATPETVPGVVLIVGLLSIIWVITLLGRCLAAAVDKPVSLGVGLTIAYLITNDFILRVFS